MANTFTCSKTRARRRRSRNGPYCFCRSLFNSVQLKALYTLLCLAVFEAIWAGMLPYFEKEADHFGWGFLPMVGSIVLLPLLSIVSSLGLVIILPKKWYKFEYPKVRWVMIAAQSIALVLVWILPMALGWR